MRTKSKVFPFLRMLFFVSSWVFASEGKADTCTHRVKPGETFTSISKKLYPTAAKDRKGWNQIIFQDNGLLDLLIAHNTHLKSIHSLKVNQTIHFPCNIKVEHPENYYKPVIYIEKQNEFRVFSKSNEKTPPSSSLSYSKVLGRSDPKQSLSQKKIEVQSSDSQVCQYEVKRGDILTRVIRKMYPALTQSRKKWAQLIYQDHGLLDLLIQYNQKLEKSRNLSPGMSLDYPCQIQVNQPDGYYKPVISIQDKVLDPNLSKEQVLEARISSENVKKIPSLGETKEACLYTVRPGDNLSTMSQNFYPDVAKTGKQWNQLIYQKNGLLDLLKLNNPEIKSVHKIYPGMQIVFPCSIEEIEKKKNIAIAPLPPKNNKPSRDPSSFSSPRSGQIRIFATKKRKMEAEARSFYFIKRVDSFDTINIANGILYSTISFAAQFKFSYEFQKRSRLGLEYEIQKLNFKEIGHYLSSRFRPFLHGVRLLGEYEFHPSWLVGLSYQLQQTPIVRATSQTSVFIHTPFLHLVGIDAKHFIPISQRGKIRVEGGAKVSLFRSVSSIYSVSPSAHFHLSSGYLHRVSPRLSVRAEGILEAGYLNVSFSNQRNIRFGPRLGMQYFF